MPSCAAFGRHVVQRCAANLYRFAASLIVRSFSARYWYRIIFLVARLQIEILRPLALLGVYPYRHDIKSWASRREIILARIMDDWLHQMAAFHRPFPIPTQVSGAAAVRKLSGEGTGLVFCSSHCFLADVALRIVAEACAGALTIISTVPNPEKGYSIWGMNRAIPVIHPDKNVLLKVRNILRRGESVVVLIDKALDTPFQSNILRLACAIQVPVIFSIPKLQPSGDMVLDLSNIHSFRSEDSVQKTLASWQAQRDRILHPTANDGGSEAHNRKTIPQTAATSRPTYF